MDIIPNHPALPQPVRTHAWVRRLLIGVAVAMTVVFVVAAGYVALLLLSFESTGWM